MSSNWDKIVKLACKPKSAAPKAKYLDPIIAATYSEDRALRDVFAALAVRLRDPSMVVMHKALLVIHTMIRAGQTDNVLGFLSGSSNDVLKLRHIANGHNDGHPLSENISSYAAYLECRIRAYRDLRYDTIKVQNENNREERFSGGDSRAASTSRIKTSSGRKLRQLTVEKGLLRETKGVQRQIDALLQCKFFLDNLEDELTLTTLTLLVKDLPILFQAGNEGVINVLEHYFEMSAVDAEQSLAIYKSFCTQTEGVVEYLSIARKLSNLLNVPVPNLRHAPTKLAGALEEYLRDPNFEQNRIEYKTNKALADGKIPNKAKPSSRQEEPSTAARPEAQPEASSSTARPRPASIQPTIDLLESIEESQPTMFNPYTNSPSTAYFQQQQQQPMMTGFNPFRQSAFVPQMTGMPPQQFVMAQPTGFASPFAQATLQSQMTGSPFPNAQPFPQQTQANPVQPQPTGFLQPQQTGFNPFRQSMAFPQNGTMSFSQGAAASPQPMQPRSASAMTFSGPPTQAGAPMTEQFQSHSPFAAALINRPASTPIGSSSGQMLKPVVSHQTGSRNPFGQLKAPSPPPVPKPPTLAELSFVGSNISSLQNAPTGMQSNGSNQQNVANQQNGPTQQNGFNQNGSSFLGQQPFSTRLASAIGDTGNQTSNMSSVASAFALSSDSTKPSPTPFTAQSPAPSQITSQMTSTSALSDSFSNLSFSASTGTNPSSVGTQPLQPQATGFAGLKAFKPTSSFGASLVESLPPATTSSAISPTNGTNMGVPSQSNLPSFSLTNTTAPSLSGPSPSLNLQHTGFSSFSTGGASLFSGASSAKGMGSTVGVGLRPQMTGGGASNPFRVSTAGNTPFGGASQPVNFSPMQTGGSGFGVSLFSPAGNSAFKPSLATIPSFTGAFPNSGLQQNQQQQQQQQSQQQTSSLI